MATGAGVVPGTKKETATGVVAGSESVIENVIENGTKTIPLAGRVQECPEDTENVPGVEEGTRSERGNRNGKGTETTETTEITETDTADLTGQVSV